jgi:sulfite reductase (ferredoxin)
LSEEIMMHGASEARIGTSVAPEVSGHSESPKLSTVEHQKASSNYLRGTLAAELADPNTDHFNELNKGLLKFHGSYQQEDRDARKNRDKTGVSKFYMFMIRLKLPGGKLTADQYLTMDDICGRYANGTLRITTRQSFQLHGVLKTNLKATMQTINAALLTTLGACGDITRNVICCPAPLPDASRAMLREHCQMLAQAMTPEAGRRAYHEIWLNGQPLSDPQTDEEPLYGKTYLPRKFKIGFALPHDNCTDLLAQCVGFLVITDNGQPTGRPIGYDLYCGGGQGQTNSRPDTSPLLAQPIGFVEPDEVIPAAQAIARLYRDHGNRADRKRARLKYVVHDWGVDRFREVLYRDYFPFPYRPPVMQPITGLDLHHGWHGMGDGRWFLGLSVENGRIKDEGSLRLRSGIRAIVSRFRCDVRLTPQQDILLCGFRTADRPVVENLLAEYGIPKPDALSQVQRWSMACPAIPTCGLAITESERALPAIIDQLEIVLRDLGLQEEPISVRMTGCPNGCARPYQSDIGLVGRSGNKYTIYVGGDRYGRRLNFELADLVPVDQIVPRLTPLLRRYQAERQVGESFGDFCTRVGIDSLRQTLSTS